MDAPAAGFQPAVLGAVITAAVAVVVAVITQVQTGRRERERVRSDRRREALLDAQNAAFALRGRLRDYGAALRAATRSLPSPPILGTQVEAPEDPQVLAARDDADGWLDVCLARLEDPCVAEAVTAWRSAANQHFISVQDVSVSEEQGAWVALHRAVRDALYPPERTLRPRRQRGRATTGEDARPPPDPGPSG